MANFLTILSEAAGEAHVEPASFGIIDATAWVSIAMAILIFLVAITPAIRRSIFGGMTGAVSLPSLLQTHPEPRRGLHGTCCCYNSGGETRPGLGWFPSVLSGIVFNKKGYHGFS